MAVVPAIQVGANIEVVKNTLAQPYIGVMPLVTGSGDQANAAAVATLAPTATSCAYMSGFVVTGTGAQAASTVLVTVTGLLGGTRSFCYGFIASVTAPNVPLALNFNPPLPASGLGVPIVVTVPAGGTGNLHSLVTAYGYASTIPAIPVI